MASKVARFLRISRVLRFIWFVRVFKVYMIS